MTSVGVQASITDPEGILGVITTFHTQLQDLAQINKSLVELNSSRGQSIEQSQAMMDSLEGKIQNLVTDSANMGTMLRENQHSIEDNDKILEELTNRKEHLDTEIRNLEMQVQSVQSEDVDNEQRLTGFAVEELYQKMDTLSFLHRRLDRANQDKQDEWADFKSDCLSHQAALRPYQEMKDQLDELILARYIGMQSVKGADQSERDLAQRLCDHHTNKMQLRQLRDQLTESQIKEKDLEDEIGALVAMKRDLWRQCLDLENCLDELKDSSEERTCLRPSPAYSDIPEVAECRHPANYDSDDESEEEATDQPSCTSHGRQLHRCPKSTDISMGSWLDTEEQEDTDIVSTVPETTEEDQQTTTDNHLDAAHTEEPEIEEAPEASTEESSSLHGHVHGVQEGPKANSSMIMKIRKRMGIGQHSSSIKIKSTKLEPSRSARGFSVQGFVKKRR